MSQVPGATSLENSLCLHDQSLWRSASEAYGKKEDGRGSGDKRAWDGKKRLFTCPRGKRAWDGKKVWGSTDLAISDATSLTKQKTAEGNPKEYAHHNKVLKMLHERNYEIDFHGYTCDEARQVLKVIIINITQNMKGDSKQQFTIITGKGIHSPYGKPAIKPTVLGFLKKNHIEHVEHEKNSGRLNITVYKKDNIVM